jgi:E3 ubiquitin-protein ligase DOA10
VAGRADTQGLAVLMQGSDGDKDKDMCWICLEEDTDDGDTTLYAPCKCPRKVHPQCLARWQLQQAGRHEEKFCR